MYTVSEQIAELSTITYPRELEEYQHEGVIAKFRDDWDVEEDEARDIFSEMKKFLYISEIGLQRSVQIEIDEPTLIIDKMWHQFVLFTKDYEAFCKRFFGKMVHHAPFDAEQLAQWVNDSARNGMTLNEHKQMCLERQLNLIESTMGIETVKKWYVDYANKYSPRKMNALQRAVYPENIDELPSPLDPKIAEEMGPSELIEGILQQTSPEMYCGRRCRSCTRMCRSCRRCRRCRGE